MKGVFWSLAFIGSLVFLAACYYIKSSSVRAFVDPRLPWVNSYLHAFVRHPGDSTGEESNSSKSSSSLGEAAAPSAPVAPRKPAVFDIDKFAENKAEWPAKVKLLKPTTFPAVVNGKIVGDIVAPAGAEVGLVKITGGRLGVEYQGGGAFLPVEQTDLVARWQSR